MEDDEEEVGLRPTAVVINTPSTGWKVIVQMTDNLLIETEMPFEGSFQDNLAFVVSETIRLADRILLHNPNKDPMFQ